jgi:hypothetical protein
MAGANLLVLLLADGVRALEAEWVQPDSQPELEHVSRLTTGR